MRLEVVRRQEFFVVGVGGKVALRLRLTRGKLGFGADPAPRGAYTGAVPPPTDCLCPPKRGLCPEEINRLGASGAQIEIQISVFCGLTPDFVTYLG